MSAPPSPRDHFSTGHLQRDLAGRSVRGGALALVSQAAKFLLQLGSTVVLARLLSPSEFGLIYMVVGVTGLIGLLKEFNLTAAIIQRPDLDHRLLSTVFWANAGLGVVTALLTAASAPLLAWFFGERRLVAIALLWAITYLLDSLSVQHDALLRRQMRWRAVAAIDVGSNLAGLLTAIGLAAAGWSYWALVARQLVLISTKVAACWLTSGWRPGRPSRRTGVRSMLRAGGEMTGESLLLYVARNIDYVLIGRAWGKAQLGLYAKAYETLLLPVRQVIWPLNGVALPVLSRTLDDPSRYRSAFLRVLEKIGMLTMPGVALAIGAADWIIRVFLGPAWVEAAPLFAILGISAMIEPVLNTTTWLFVSQGRTRELLHSGAAGASITVAAIFAGLPWGPIGVATALAISGLGLRAPLTVWWACRRGAVKAGDFYRVLAPSLCAAVACVLALWLLRRGAPGLGPVVGLALSGVLAAAVAGAVFLLIPAGRRGLLDAWSWAALLASNASAKSRA